MLFADAQTINYEEPESWCTLAYYEMNNRVGEPFDAKIWCLIIDGFTSPSSQDRFCVGRLTNVNRTAAIEETRRLIGMIDRLLDKVYFFCKILIKLICKGSLLPLCERYNIKFLTTDD
jgi:hypothetical protein